MALSFVSRSAWGAKPPKAVTRRPPSELDGVAVHWFEKPRAASSHEGCPALLRSVQKTHTDPGGLGVAGGGSDIGYNHAVCPHGTAFTLRGFGVQTGANGTTEGNRKFAAVVYMAGTGDALTDAAKPVLAAVIRAWMEKGAGPVVKPHHDFTGTACPGPDLMSWLAQSPKPWADGGTRGLAAAEQEGVPDWLLDFVWWRLADDGVKAKRPRSVPARPPEAAWEAAERMHRMAALMGPQEAFLQWVQWTREGADAASRPHGVPKPVPPAWPAALEQLERIFAGKAVALPVVPAAAVPATPSNAKVTAKAQILAAPRAEQKPVTDHVVGRPHGEYSDKEVRHIVDLYWRTARAVGMDPLVVVAQMVLETGNLTSEWSQRPRRNPAGIGVTGAAGAGVQFPSWDRAVRAHVGRLLAYALPPDEETASQRTLVEEALAWRSLPARLRGAAPTLSGLTGTWATDPRYAGKIARVANELRTA